GVDRDVEVVAGLGVVDRDRQLVGLGLPEQRDLETIVRAEVQFLCPLARHLCLLSSLHCNRSVPSRRTSRNAADRRVLDGNPASRSSEMRTSKRRSPPGGAGFMSCGRRGWPSRPSGGGGAGGRGESPRASQPSWEELDSPRAAEPCGSLVFRGTANPTNAKR